MLPDMACLISSSDGADGLLQQGHGAHDLAAGAVAALVAVVLHKGRLHRVQIAGLTDAFDGGDLVALVHHGEGKAAVDAAAVDVDRAGAALAVVAAFLGAGEVDALAEGVEQRGARVEIAQGVVLAVDAQCDVACAARLRPDPAAAGSMTGAAAASGAAPARTPAAPSPDKKRPPAEPALFAVSAQSGVPGQRIAGRAPGHSRSDALR